MSDRYIWAGEIIDTGDGGVNLDGEETAGRMNELDRENADLRRQLAEATELIEALITEYGAECPLCHGDGVARCDNPDHESISFTGGEIGRLGCPVCGHDPEHRVKGEKCEMCGGTGSLIPTKEATDE